MKSTIRKEVKPEGNEVVLTPKREVATKSTAQIMQEQRIKKEMNPICTCGAGPCLIEECDKKPNEGRQYYVCHIEREQGACYHFQWCDSSNIEVYPGSMNDD